MVKLRSSSCGPLVQGMMLLALLLLASIQAAPLADMAGIFEKGGRDGAGMAKKLVGFFPEAASGGPKELQVPTGGAEAAETAANMGLTELAKKEGWKEFSNGAKKGIKFRKYWCKAQDLMDKLGGRTDLGRLGDLAWKLRTFSYQLTSEVGLDVCWSDEEVPAAGMRPSTTLVPSNDGRYYVQMTGIRVGQFFVDGQTWTGLNRPPPLYLYLSSTQPNTYIESNLYARLRAAVDDQMRALTIPGATPPSPLIFADKLCYKAAALPGIAIVLASNNAAMELAAKWEYTQAYDMYCMGILPATTVQPVLGRTIQSGKTMTIDLTAAGGLTLTFTS